MNSLGNTLLILGNIWPYFGLLFCIWNRQNMYKSQGQVPITQILALFVTNFQHVSFILLLLPGRLISPSHYEGLLKNL